MTPEHTLVDTVDAIYLAQNQTTQQNLQGVHSKLSQQNSLDKAADVLVNGNNPSVAVNGSGAGPQTIADLHQKLVQLTNQPSESLNVGTPPISYPATPQSQATGGYDTYMHSLQQKLVNIGMPASNIQTTVRILILYFVFF